MRIFFVPDSASLFLDGKDGLRLTAHPLIRDGGELMPTYIYKGCKVKREQGRSSAKCAAEDRPCSWS